MQSINVKNSARVRVCCIFGSANVYCNFSSGSFVGLWSLKDNECFTVALMEVAVYDPMVYHCLPFNTIQYRSVPLDHSMIFQQDSGVLSMVI